jgi:hypothetical protein
MPTNSALLYDGPHRGLVHPVGDDHPEVIRLTDCGHEQTCRYQQAGGQQFRTARTYRWLTGGNA